MGSQGKGAYVSDTPYTSVVPLTTATAIANPPDAIMITNTLTALSIVDQNGATTAFAGTFPASGVILLLSPSQVVFAPAGSVAALYRS